MVDEMRFSGRTLLAMLVLLEVDIFEDLLFAANPDIVVGLVAGELTQALDDRVVEECVRRDVSWTAHIDREGHILPSRLVQLPTFHER